MIKTMYNDISSMVINNGNTTKEINLQRGIRQGCPASAYLFILCSELLSTYIRNCENIKGIVLDGKTHKVLQFADDTVLLAKDSNDIKEYLKILNDFGLCSGLRINKSKTELVNLNLLHDKLSTICGLKWCEGPFKYLGVWFSSNYSIQEYKNYRHRVDNMINLLKIWKQRDLSLKGKVVILRSLALSQLIYPMSLLEIPEWVITEVNDLFFNFLWSGKPPKVKKDVVIRSIKEGGLKMVDIDSMARAVKTKWAIKIFCEADHKWCSIPNMLFRNICMKDLIASTYHPSFLPEQLPMFYYQCFHSLSEVKSSEFQDDDVEGIRHQKLWFNRLIVQKNKPFFYHDWYKKGVKLITQLFAINGKLLSPDNFFRKYSIPNTNINLLKYYSLRDAIPGQWKRVITEEPTRADIKDISVLLVINCRGLTRNAKYVPNKDLYWTYIDKKLQARPISDYAWSNRYNMDITQVKNYYYLPYMYVAETKIHSLQFKIQHFIYPCKMRRKQWRVHPTGECSDCGLPDDLAHHFYHCSLMVNFWSSLNKWWSGYCTDCVLAFDEKGVLLGCIDNKCHKEQRNTILLWVKWYVYRTKHNNGSVFMYNFLSELAGKLQVENIRALRYGRQAKFIELWYELSTFL
jgi:hypothetical protein